MAAFTGTLNTNEFYNSLFNAYRLIEVFADGLDGLDDSLANRFRADGGMYQDKSVFTDMDVLWSRVWDPTDTNVLAPEMTAAPVQQEIVLDQKRQIGLYTDQYLSKRAWMDPYVFDGFNSVVQAQVGNTRRLYEQRMVDTYIGTVTTDKGKQTVELDLDAAVGTATGQEANGLQATEIAATIADVFVAMGDSSREWNDYGFMKAYSRDDFFIIWNAGWYNKIRYIDLPTIYHIEDLLASGKVLPAKYFGAETAAGTADGTTNRATQEYSIRVNNDGAYAANGSSIAHVFPGDVLPSGTPIVAWETAETYAAYTATVNGRSLTVNVASTVHAYTEDANVICKIIHKNGIRYLSSFETETEFFNPKNLSSNRYLTWMFAKPQYLYNYPLVTLVADTQA